MSTADFIGLIGVAAYLSAYGLLQFGVLKVEDDRYALLNGVGAIAILYSLIFDFNLPSFITQAAWLTFTIIGYVRSRSKRAHSKTESS
ncbi:CBU_0592 family membrane protein [Microvirga rosea]|uniref:CBU_0592 family membrane protein n=1 Tax=Microvirga rosea TaxID=2715425 RepID=UPI001D0A1FB9|nr:cyclic nucleotide-binding protein [Microvirga rosea]MCB8821261.1 cyclic nucleotide-binding protein [Microvirga rosea]